MSRAVFTAGMLVAVAIGFVHGFAAGVSSILLDWRWESFHFPKNWPGLPR